MFSPPIEPIDPEATDAERDRRWFGLLTAPEGLSRRGQCLATASAVQNMLRALVDQVSAARKGDFNGQIELARQHGILSDQEADRCHVVRRIRNELAHNERANFSIGPAYDLSLSLFIQGRHGSKPDAFWIYYQSVSDIALSLRSKMRVAGLLQEP